MRRSKLWWLVLAVIVTVGGGAAGGTILAGHLQGTIVVDVSPPLKLEQPVIQLLPEGRSSFPSLSIERTAFKVIANVNPGDSFLISLPVLNSAAVDIKALLNLSYSSGVVLSITGSGVINDVVASSYHTWKFTADAGAQGGNVYPIDGLNIEVDVLPSFVGTSVEISGSIVATTGLGGAYLVYPFSPTQAVLYLHNNPSPPTLDTNSQANLPMDMFPGIAAVLYNYDQDMDSSPGRVILHGGSGAAETNLAKYQNWQMTLSQNLSISGNVTAVLWSAAKNFDQTARGVVTAYLRDISDGTSALIGSGTLDLTPWQQGSSTWVERKITIPTSNYTVPAGHALELKTIVGGTSSDVWLAYDTSLYPSRLILNSKPAANFSATFVSSTNVTATIAFTDNSTSDQGIVSWLWNFGDNTTSTQQNPTHVYAAVGSYPVYLTVKEADGDSNTQKKIATVSLTGVTLSNTMPTANFSATPTSGIEPLKVAFTDLSTSGASIVSWLWNFGDGGTSTQQNPTHIYPSMGTYTVSLTVGQADGGSSTLTKTAFITVASTTPPSVTTNNASNITFTGARLNGNLTSLGTASSVNVYFQWGTSPGSYPNSTTPQVMNTTGTFYFDLTGLNPWTTYYFRAVAVGRGAGYGAEKSFTTLSTPPGVTTNDASNITTTGARLNGNLTSLGTAPSVNVYFQWGTSPGVYPNTTTPQVMNTTGTFYFDLTGLNPWTTYYFRAVAVGHGTSYGAEKSFTTLSIPPSVTTNDASNITTTGARLNGNLTSLGTAPSANVSFQWGTSPGVYPNTTTPQVMNTTGTFYFDLTGLTPGVTYYFRAQAVGHGTGYGAEKSFTTLAVLGTLYLHNNPTPPTGNTNQQANLPMNSDTVTASVLYNYDTDKNPDPARTIKQGGSGPTETALDRYQNWQKTVYQDTRLSDNVTAVLWSATKDFVDNKRGVVTVYLRDFNGSTYTEIASGTLDLANWQQGSATWVQRMVTITGINYTIMSGHILEVKVIVGGASTADMWFAYDTTSYPSRVICP